MQAAIFDVDGLLIDSEPIWRETEVEVFGRFGIALTEAMTFETTGLRIDEVAAHWIARSGVAASKEAIVAEVVELMVARIRERARALDGGPAAIAACRAMGWRVAAASSSPERVIDAALARVGVAFDAVVSAEHERYGKPHPAVILTTAERLGVAPTECLVFEDSVNGVLAAKAARARCVAVPQHPDPRFVIADRVLASLTVVDRTLLASL